MQGNTDNLAQVILRNIANVNPVSHLVEGFRSLTIESLDATAVAQTVLIPLGLSILTLTVALGSLRKRVAAR